MRADVAATGAKGTAQKRNRSYVVFLVVLMGLVALMDQYLSTVKTTAIPYLTKEYGITAARFQWFEALYLISSFFIFALNGLNDLIGRKRSMLVLILMMGLNSRVDSLAGAASAAADRPLGFELEVDVWGHVPVHDPGARDVVLYERDGSL
jgi:MFS family permease